MKNMLDSNHMKLLLATSNLHKILELKAMLKSGHAHARGHVHEWIKDLDILSLRDFPDYQAPSEDGATFKENAELKARHAAAALGIHALADDSGLIVPALNGEPGVHSRRYAGEEATDKDNREKLINKLKEIPEEGRTGYFECALSFASPEGIVKTTRGLCEGRLLLEMRGRNGFGYDPLFIKHDYNKTMAELEAETKNRISHRRKALDKLIVVLEARLSPTT